MLKGRTFTESEVLKSLVRQYDGYAAERNYWYDKYIMEGDTYHQMYQRYQNQMLAVMDTIQNLGFNDDDMDIARTSINAKTGVMRINK